MKLEQKVFLGLSVRDAQTMIDSKHSPDLLNVQINNPIGALSSMIGIQKYTNAGSPEAVVAIHQLEDTLFFRGGSKLWRGLNANFIAFPECGRPPTTGRVQFVDITKDTDSDITAWLWDFGDGNTSTDQHPMHTYLYTGVYTVSLKVFVGDLWFQKVEEQYIRFDSSRIWCDAFLDIPWAGEHWCYNSDTGEWEYYDGETIVASGEDSYVHASLPDDNFGSESRLKIMRQSGVELCRIFIKNPHRKDTLYLYCFQVGIIDDANIEAYEVIESWDESTITWNNQPSLGGRISTTNIPDSAGWRSFDIGGVENLCLLFPEQGSGYYTPGSLFFYSINNSSNNPYFTYPVAIPQCCIADDIMPDGLKPHIAVTGDSCVSALYENEVWYHKDTNYGTGDLAIRTRRDRGVLFSNERIFVKRGNAITAKLFLMSMMTRMTNARDIGIYAIDPDDWSEDTLTWNNQPSLGALLDTVTIPTTNGETKSFLTTWYSFDVGTAKSVCIKFKTEFSGYGTDEWYQINFRSKNHGISAYHPYLVRT